MDLQPNSILNNRYRIIKILGQGGMGAVYLAHDSTLDTKVAIKANFKTTKESSTQFLREARLLASLRHTNLPRVIDYFYLDQNQYLVMDYIPGEDLDDYVSKYGKPTLEQIFEWAKQLGSALNYLHGCKPPVIHRDIKPGNIKLTPSGEVMLVDFGIAKAAEASQATATGALGYTPGYAPPEQYGTGHTRTGPYSDQYAFAATLYRLLTGEKPADSVKRVVGEAVLIPISRLNPTVPAHVQRAIEKAMSLKFEDRYPGVSDFVKALTSPLLEQTRTQPATDETIAQPLKPEALGETVSQAQAPSQQVLPEWKDTRAEAAQQGLGYIQPQTQKPIAPLPSQAPPVERTGGGWKKWLFIGLGLALIAVVVIGVTGFFLLNNATINLSSNPATIEPELVIQQTTIAAGWAALSAIPGVTQTPVSTKAIAEERSTPLVIESFTPTVPPEPIATPFGGGGVIAIISQQGSDIAQIWTMRVESNAGGQPSVTDLVPLTTSRVNKQNPAWSPDGRWLLYVASGGEGLGLDIWKMDYTNPSAAPVNLTMKAGNQIEPAWSPDGSLIAYTDNSRADGVSAVEIMDAAGGGTRRIISEFAEASPAWHPSGDRLFFVRIDRGYKVLCSYAAPNFNVAENIDPNNPFGQLGNVEDPAVSSDGEWIAYTQANSRMTYIYLLRADSQGSDFRNLSGDAYREHQPEWSPDGKWIVFSSSRGEGNLEVYIMDSNGQYQTNLTNDPGIDMQPAWRPVY